MTCEKGYKALFSDVSFTLSSGELLQLEGANGAGKTTLLRILCGLSEPSNGQIFWDEQPIPPNLRTFQNRLLYIGHRQAIKLDLTPLENLNFFTQLHSTKSKPAPHEALRQMQMLDYADIPCRNLSAGQKRRVALSTLIMTDAKLWILDEPFTAIDSDGVALIEQIIKRHLEQQGLVVIATHQPMSESLGNHTQILSLSDYWVAQ